MLTLQQKLAQHQSEEVFFAQLSLGQLQHLKQLLRDGLDDKRVLLAIFNREDELAGTN